MPSFQPVKSKKIYEEIVAQIKDLIAKGGLNPGDRLLSERELAEKLAVSRASVREALRTLELMGLVEIRTGEGTFVREASTDAFVHPLAAILALERGTFHQVYEVRRIIESACAHLAAERVTPKELMEMEAALRQMEEDMDQGRLGDLADTRFHLAIAEATHNPILATLMQTISDSVHQVVKSARRKLFETPGNAQQLLQQHWQIFYSIRDRKGNEALNHMFQHLIFAEGEMAKELDLIPPGLRDKER